MSDTLKIYSNDVLSRHMNYPTAKAVEIYAKIVLTSPINTKPFYFL